MDIYFQLIEHLQKKKKVALATAIETKGSTPQVAGASALFSPEGLLSGTVGGGIVEAEITRQALQALKEKKPRLFSINLANEISSKNGAICGGEMRILIDPLCEKHLQVFQSLKQALSKRRPGILATSIEGGSLREGYSLSRSWIAEKMVSQYFEKEFPGGLEARICEALLEGKPYFLKIKNKGYSGRQGKSFLYLEPHFPLPRLVIAGAGHIGQALAHLGKFLSFEVIIIDDRLEFANQERFPEADQIIVGDISQTIRHFPLASDTYLVIVTRGHSQDEQALRACLKSQVGYIGLIGSKRKILLMRERFLKKHWATPVEFDRVCAPVGIQISSKTVAEITISIAAELVLVRNRKRERKALLTAMKRGEHK